MNSQEVSALLALMTDMWPTLTPRTPEDATLRMRNWHASLNYDIPHEFAVRFVHRHWGSDRSTQEPTPGMVNNAWANERERSDHLEPCGGPYCDGHGWENGIDPKTGNRWAKPCPACHPRIRVSGAFHPTNPPGVPMPEDIKAMIRNLANRKKI